MMPSRALASCWSATLLSQKEVPLLRNSKSSMIVRSGTWWVHLVRCYRCWRRLTHILHVGYNVFRKSILTGVYTYNGCCGVICIRIEFLWNYWILSFRFCSFSQYPRMHTEVVLWNRHWLPHPNCFLHAVSEYCSTFLAAILAVAVETSHLNDTIISPLLIGDISLC